jgi:hypothetical protein
VEISTEMAKQGNWPLSQRTGLEIQQMAKRHECWMAIAKTTYTEMGWQKSLQKSGQWQNEEARLFYLKGWAENIQPTEADAACLQQALPLLAGDTESIEVLLQAYALHQIFFERTDPVQVQRLDRTLGLGWALDIAARFPKEAPARRLSTNLKDWLHEVADEDERDQIELWARQVAKGKISEADFAEKIGPLS